MVQKSQALVATVIDFHVRLYQFLSDRAQATFFVFIVFQNAAA